MKFKETDDLFRLYRREWVIVATTVGGSALFCVESAREWADENLLGRVHDTDIRFEANTDTPSLTEVIGSKFWCHVKVFKDNLKGEFKWSANAEAYARAEGYDEFTVVPRNSKQDHEIRSYGVKKL